MPPLDDLLDDLFDGKKPAFYFEFAGWLRGSRRFKAFALTYRGEIRTKLKNAVTTQIPLTPSEHARHPLSHKRRRGETQ